MTAPVRYTREQMERKAIRLGVIAEFCGKDSDDAFHLLVAAAMLRQAAAEGQGWQPIETAPKDGTAVDLWSTTSMSRLPHMRWVKEDPSKHPSPELVQDGWKNESCSVYGCFVADQFTHWGPLPSAPQPPEGHEP